MVVFAVRIDHDHGIVLPKGVDDIVICVFAIGKGIGIAKLQHTASNDQHKCNRNDELACLEGKVAEAFAHEYKLTLFGLVHQLVKQKQKRGK